MALIFGGDEPVFSETADFNGAHDSLVGDVFKGYPPEPGYYGSQYAWRADQPRENI